MLDDLDKSLKRYPTFVQLNEKTGIKKSHFAIGFFALFVMIFILWKGFDLLCNLIAFSIPFYSSMKALRMKGPDKESRDSRDSRDSKEEETKFWLSYWLIFAFIIIFENLFDEIINYSSWSIVYYTTKVLVITWCFFPSTRGALIIVDKVLAPLFLVVQSLIEKNGDQ